MNKHNKMFIVVPFSRYKKCLVCTGAVVIIRGGVFWDFVDLVQETVSHVRPQTFKFNILYTFSYKSVFIMYEICV